MKLLDGETALLESDNKKLMLTTCRLRQRAATGYTVIFLEDLCSIQGVRVTHGWLLVLALIAAVGSVRAFSLDSGAGVFALIVAAGLLV